MKRTLFITNVNKYMLNMNLYIFNETRRGAVYGVGTYIRELTEALRNSDVHICVVNLLSDKPHIETEETDGIRQWYFPAPIPEQRTADSQEQRALYQRNVVYLLQLYIQDKKDLIFHLNFPQCGSLVEALKEAFDCKVVSVVHFSDWGFTVFDNLPRLRNILKEEHPDGFGENLQQSFKEEKSLYLKVDRIICMSNYMKEVLCLDYGLSAAKISVIPNGLEEKEEELKIENGELNRRSALAKIENGELPGKEALREKWHIGIEERVLLFAGRIDEVKGVVYLVKIFREVLKEYPDCRLIIAGSGNYDLCLQEAKEIYTKITFTGLLEKQELFEIYKIADIGVVPSLFEPFGYVAVEMMMHGLPVVTTATSGLNEVVDDTCGLKIPITILSDSVEVDSSLFAEKVVYLLRHPMEAKQMGQNGRKRYLRNYSSKTFCDNMLQVYKSMCNNHEDGKIKTLIITGQNSHKWEVSHVAITQILENSGLFTVDIAISPEAGKIKSNFKPDFNSYQLVVLDYCGDRWPEETEESFLNFVEKGGGVVIYHAANNAFRDWKEYNRIIGFGGWENRNETDGPYIYMKAGQLIYDEESPGRGGSHGSQHEFVFHCGNPDHPVTKGLPTAWRHAQDELYDRMRGPGIVKDVLFWAYSDPATRGSGRDEMAMFTVDYGRARIFHTTLGHAGNTLDNNIAMQCAGFQVTLLRGAEWAATGKVTQPVPDDFPTETTISLRKNYQ
ncbi:TIGR04157 family glycosyltransferase [Parabacteroides sp. OttesenSCG-928-G07]|nr:TIGR04157 family glycosyltransferase [Parabacteroides sp. OttesenSCG-928-G21]MDL2278129.1 TIGR04157 family glycosyltransferase [Parabacteroides sp. OttesenSCG-928-G07]